VPGGGTGEPWRLELPNLLGCDGGQRNEDDEDQQFLHEVTLARP
jgi:hypothetical protein